MQLTDNRQHASCNWQITVSLSPVTEINIIHPHATERRMDDVYLSYRRQVDGYLSVTWGMLAVICQLHDDRSCLSLSYMRQANSYLSVTWARSAVICQLHEAGWRLFICCMRENAGYLSTTSGRITLSVSYIRQLAWWCPHATER
jgi:hypothetical protein